MIYNLFLLPEQVTSPNALYKALTGMMGMMSEDLRAKIKVNYSPASRRDFWKFYIEISKISLGEHGFLIHEMAPSDQKKTQN